MAPRRAVKRNAVVHRMSRSGTCDDNMATCRGKGLTRLVQYIVVVVRGVSVRAGGVVSVPPAISNPRSGGCVTLRLVERLSPHTQKEAYYST
ncbi:hypothetical protein J6590_101081 [Homalodisca vitripennis]|nr:hypothetical protein J6590_101081 [Homalodisca vitripennis]